MTEYEPYSHTDFEDGQALDLFISKSYEPFFASKARDLVSYGGAGAAKSFSAAQKLIINCSETPDSKAVVIRKYGPSLRLTCFALMKKLLNAYKIKHEPKEAKMIIEFPNGSEILFIPIADSSKDSESAERLKSLTDITWMWFEEPTELTFEEYKTARIRLRGRPLKQSYRQRIHTFNPINKNHWLHKFFFEPGLDGKLRQADKFKYTYKDNPFLDIADKQELEDLKTLDPIAYAVYALGEWGTLGNQIFNNYVVEEFNHSMNWYNEVVSGMDFGYVHPSVWLLIAIKENDIFVIDEICESKLTNPDFIAKIQPKISEYALPTLEIYCDWAEPARIEEMRRAGLNISEANKNVTEGINVVKKKRLHIHPRCANTIVQIAGYRYKEDRSGKVRGDEKPVKFNDDTMDALRYACYGLSENQRGDYSTPYQFQSRQVPVYANTGISSILRERATPPKFR